MEATAAIAVERSGNAKVGKVSATYASQRSCPAACPLMGNGCYAESGNMAMHSRRLNASTIIDPVAIAEQEATAIRSLTGKLDLRVHVVGDCPTDETAKIVSGAMREHRAKHGRGAWTYTHAWRTVDRESWGSESVLASCETAEDVREARERGYATAMVTPPHPSDRAYDRDGVKVIPCPQQTRGTTCADCGLCMRADTLGNATIGFAAHGARKRKAIDTINAIVGE